MWQIAWFLSFEGGFMALATFCLAKHKLLLPASLLLHQSEVKSAFTILTIVWQTVALFPVLGVIVQIFSSEWSYLQRRTRALVPGKTDRVSVITSGLQDQIRHAFFTRRASRAFRAAVAASLAALALHNFAPGALSISLVSVGANVPLPVGDVVDAEQLVWNCSSCPENVGVETGDLLSSVLEMEQLFSVTYGYQMNPLNCSAGLPSYDFRQNEARMTYTTEYACWHHQCRWVEDASYNLLKDNGSMVDAWTTSSLPGLFLLRKRPRSIFEQVRSPNLAANGLTHRRKGKWGRERITPMDGRHFLVRQKHKYSTYPATGSQRRCQGLHIRGNRYVNGGLCECLAQLALCVVL